MAQHPPWLLDPDKTYDWTQFEVSRQLLTFRRRLISTCKGYIGIGPGLACQGDIICLFEGCPVPVILRTKDEVGCHELIGECYIDGIMDGKESRRVDRLCPLEDFMLS